MSDKTIAVMLIDPKKRTVEKFDIAGTPEDFKRLVGNPSLDSFRIAHHAWVSHGQPECFDYGWVADKGLILPRVEWQESLRGMAATAATVTWEKVAS